MQGVFLKADKDPVIQIANADSVQGQDGVFVKIVFTLGGLSLLYSVDRVCVCSI